MAWKAQIEGSYTPQQHDPFWRGLISGLVCDAYLTPLRRATTSDVDQVRDFVETGAETSLCHGMSATIGHRTFIVTDTDLIGFGPRYLLIGDQIWILSGCKVPVVLDWRRCPVPLGRDTQ